MRVSDVMMGKSFLANLSQMKNNIDKTNREIYTGSKINTPSDSPVGTSKLIKLNDSISQSESYKKNIAYSLSFMNESVSAMEEIESEVGNLESLFAEINNPTNQPYLKNYSQKIDLAINSLLGAANRSYDGKYLFGGTDFDSKPFDFNSDKSAVEMQVASIDGEHNVKIGPSTVQKVNITGKELFGDIGTNDVFNTLIRIKEKLNNGELPADDDVKIVKDFHSNLLNKLSYAGNIQNYLESTDEMISQRILNMKNLVSMETDVDVAEAAISLQNQEYMLQVAYKTASSILPKSIVDYL
ncbi:MAG: flagellar hook-associated protein FlgL [Ignavibacteriales bacterium]